MNATPQLFAPIAQGRTAEVYAWGDGRILKLYHTWCPPDWIENEARVAGAITKAGIPSPAVGEIVEINGRRGIIYERVPGPSMLQDLNAHPWQLLRHARSLAILQSQFVRVTVPGLRGYRQGLGHSIQRAPHLTAETRARLLAHLETLPDGQTLCHADFHPGNVILSPRGPVVIDWMTASIGSPWADVARSSMILQIGGRAAGKQLSPLVRLALGLFHTTYLGHYRSLNPDRHGELKRWLPVIAAARLDEGIEPERAGLLEWVDDGLRANS